MIKKKDRTTEIDRGLGHYGETHDDGKIILNPARGDLLNTIIHERLHRKYHGMSEAEVQRRSKEIETNMSIREARDMLESVYKETNGTWITHTQSKVSKEI